MNEASWQVLERLHRKLKKDGILAVLKKGMEVDNARLDLLYRLPYNDLNPDVKAKYESNRYLLPALQPRPAERGRERQPAEPRRPEVRLPVDFTDMSHYT